MKKIHLILLLFLAVSLNAFSDDYLTIIAEKSCGCIDSLPDKLSAQQANLKLSMCMIDAAKTYKKQIKKDYSIDLDNVEKQDYAKLGKIIGIKMASVCPDKLLKVTNKQILNESKTTINASLRGNIVRVETDFFVSFSVKEENSGKIVKIVWLSLVNTEFDLKNQYKELVGKNVEFQYKIQEFFDPRINEYRPFNIASKLDILK